MRRAPAGPGGRGREPARRHGAPALDERRRLDGFLLSATTSWVFFHHRWVTAKFVAAIAALYLGVFVLLARMDGAVAAVRVGDGREATALAVVAAVMAGGFAFLAWLSVAEPGGRSRRRAMATPAPTSVVALAVLAPTTATTR